MADIRFWLGMLHRAALKRNDKLMVGNIDSGKPDYIDVAEILSVLTTDDLPEGLANKYITPAQQATIDGLAADLLTLAEAQGYFYPKTTNPAGYLTAASSIAAAKITGLLAAALIPNLAAGKITSGTFSAARIPNLPASKITSGTFPIARIPMIPTSKIEGYALELADYILKTAIGSANGVAPLDVNLKVPVGFLPGLDASKIISGQFPIERMPAGLLTIAALDNYYPKSETEAYTVAEKQKLSDLTGTKWKGVFTTLDALIAAYPEGAGQTWPQGTAGWYADVDAAAGQPVKRYLWDANDNTWEAQQGEAAAGQPIIIVNASRTLTDADHGAILVVTADVTLSIGQSHANPLALRLDFACKIDAYGGDVLFANPGPSVFYSFPSGKNLLQGNWGGIYRKPDADPYTGATYRGYGQWSGTGLERHNLYKIGETSSNLASFNIGFNFFNNPIFVAKLNGAIIATSMNYMSIDLSANALEEPVMIYTTQNIPNNVNYSNDFFDVLDFSEWRFPKDYTGAGHSGALSYLNQQSLEKLANADHYSISSGVSGAGGTARANIIPLIEAWNNPAELKLGGADGDPATGIPGLLASEVKIRNKKYSKRYQLLNVPTINGVSWTLENMPELTYFHLYNNRPSASILGFTLNNCPKLIHLYIRHYQNAGPDINVDHVYEELSASGLFNGYLYLADQFVRTTASDTARGNLVVKGWTIEDKESRQV